MTLSTTRIARGQAGELETLHQDVAELKHTVERLDARIETIEQRLSDHAESHPDNDVATTSAALTPSPGVSPRDQWHRVTAGMSVQQVEALLGRPAKTIDAGSRTVWYYAYPEIGNGSIVFAPDGSVIDWQTPPFNTWW